MSIGTLSNACIFLCCLLNSIWISDPSIWYNTPVMDDTGH